MSDERCIFCQIAFGKIPAKIVAQTASSVAFMDAFPVAAGHVIAIPKRHCEKMQDMDGKECADLFELVRDLIARVDDISGATLVAVHNGKDSGQEIPHVHVHMIPRGKNDGAGPVHSMFEDKVQAKDTDDAYDAIRRR